MQKARYGLYGDLIDLKTFLEREGIDPRKWRTKPVCPECGENLHAYDVKRALGFKEVSWEVGKRRPRKPGFDHPDNPGDECPSSLRSDPRFAGFGNNEIDARTRERNRNILLDPTTKAINQRVLRILMHALTGKADISEEDRQRLHKNGEKWAYGLSALGQYPWLLPYILVLAEAPTKRNFPRGDKLIAYRAIGSQQLPYSSFDQERVIANVPKYTQLFFVDEKGQTTGPFRRGGTQEVIFEISAVSSVDLSRGPLRPNKFAKIDGTAPT